MDFDESAEEAAFRAEAHAWLSAHAKLKDPRKSTPMSMGEADPEAERDRLAEAYAREHLRAETAAAEGFVDEIIEPVETRDRLAVALATFAGGGVGPLRSDA